MEKILENNNDTKLLGVYFNDKKSYLYDDNMCDTANLFLDYNSLNFDADCIHIKISFEGGELDILKFINILMLIHIRCNSHGFKCTIEDEDGYFLITIYKKKYD